MLAPIGFLKGGAAAFNHAANFGADLVDWWRGDLGVTKDGSDRLSAWVGQQTGNTFAASGAARPTWEAATFGGKNAIYFDGVGNFITFNPTGTGGTSYVQPNTYLYVIEIITWPVNGHLQGSAWPTGAQNTVYNAGGTVTMYAGSSRNAGTAASWVAAGQMSSIWVFDNGAWVAYRNGVVVAAFAGFGVGTQGATGMTVADSVGSPGNVIECRVAEIVLLSGGFASSAAYNAWMAYVEGWFGPAYTPIP